MRGFGCGALLVVALLCASACDRTGQGTPTVPMPTVTGLRLSQPPDLVVTGDRFTVRATTQLSTGEAVPVTTGVAWETSAADVADVSSDGTVTAHTAGTAEIRARYEGKTATVEVEVFAPVTLAGRVHEAPPTQSRGVGGAVVEVVSGRYQGSKVVADSDGSFVLGPIAGPLTASFSHPRFETASLDFVTRSTSTLDVALLPLPTIISAEFKTVAWQGVRSHPQHMVRFDVHRPGTIEVLLEKWNTAYDGDYLHLEVKDENGLVLSHRLCDWTDWALRVTYQCDSYSGMMPVRLHAAVQGGTRYELRLFTKRGLFYDTLVVVRHPA